MCSRSEAQNIAFYAYIDIDNAILLQKYNFQAFNYILLILFWYVSYIGPERMFVIYFSFAGEHMNVKCENLSCLLNQLGDCFGAKFLSRQPAALQSDAYWQAAAEEENVRRKPINAAPVQAEFLRREHIKDTRHTWEVTRKTHCRRRDRTLKNALTAYDVTAAPYL